MVIVKLFVVFAIEVPAVAKLSVDDSHPKTLPVFPDKVKVVLFAAVHFEVPPETVPPTDAGLTVTITALEVTDGAQVPLTITS
ncbi:hypothetical protein D3C85_996580 [compost metagenome]